MPQARIPAGAKVVEEFELEATTGKALPVHRGQVLHVEQIGNGQCLDFNAFNLYDYKDHLHTLHTLAMEGTAWPTTGNYLWSRPPRHRIMFTIIADSVGHNDLLGARCTAFTNEYWFGLEYHTNCQDIFSEAIRQWGLTPDDTHDSFNGFMNTWLSENGGLVTTRNYAKPGDYLELLAQMDVLAVPIACGSSYWHVSNFENKGLLVCVYEATEEQKRKWLLPEGRQYKNQRAPEDFANKDIRVKRELEGDPNYKPDWSWLPITKTAIHVPFTQGEMDLVEALADTREWGDEPSDIVRAVFISWYVGNRTRSRTTRTSALGS